MEINTYNNGKASASESFRAASLLSNQSREVFLSVIVTTQGRRLEELNDLFLCLSAQVCTCFDVVLLTQDVEEEIKQEMDGLCEHLKEIIGINLRSVEMKTNNLVTVLNETIDHLEGSYFAVLDEGDLLFDNWVSSFQTLAEQTPGKVLFVYPLHQEWQVTLDNRNDSRNMRTLKAIGSFNNCYCHDFDFRDQLYYNDCPSVSLAFPTHCVQNSKLRYDVSLKRIASWDFLMRVVAQCGINVSNEPSSINRAWKSNVYVKKAFDRNDWNREYQAFSEKLKSLPCISDTTISVQDGVSRDALFSPEFLMAHCIFEYAQNGREEVNLTCLPLPSDRAGFDIVFASSGVPIKGNFNFRFTGLTCFTLHDFKTMLVDSEGKELIVPLSECEHSGFQVNGNHIIILGESPTIKVKTPQSFNAVEVCLAVVARKKVQDIHIHQLARGKKSLFLGRCWRYLKRQIKNYISSKEHTR